MFPRGDAVQTVVVRSLTMVLGVVGGVAFAVAVAVGVAVDPATVGWVLVGPTPFFAVGLFVAVRRPDRPAGMWCLGVGTGFMVAVCLGDVLLPVIGNSSVAWLVSLVWQWAGNASVVIGIGLLGFFPGGRPRAPGERWVLRVAWGVGLFLPVLFAVTHPSMGTGAFPDPANPRITSPMFVPATAAAGPLAGQLSVTFAAWIVLGFVLLYLRYRRTTTDERRRIRLLLLGMCTGLVLWTGLFGAAYTLDERSNQVIVVFVWPLILLFVLGSTVAALAYDRVVAVDEIVRRSVVYRALWALIAAAYVAAAAALGVVAGRFLPVGAAVLLAAGAALLFQPLQRRLEQLADRWVFGARMDGYRVLARFGAAVESAPGSADLLGELAEAVREGLSLIWVRVRLDLPDASGTLSAHGVAGPAPVTGEPALVVPLVDGGATLGRIECGPRRDGPFVDEDHRLLHHLAAQAATAVRNLHLTAELGAQLQVIRQQAADLSASRERIVTARDAERRRMQRDLHDGVQQDVVVLTAELAMARQRLLRGDPRADETLADLQRGLAALLNQVREFAHAIHPPVLADQGLLEAIEAQAGRLPLEVVIEADVALRGVRYPQQVEATAWYVLSEALTNVVKHARARQVHVVLGRPDGRLTVEISDDGDGFDPTVTRGLGLAGLADRISIASGVLRVASTPGAGTTLYAEIPLATETADA
jgi:signal transduction histidine kinase